MARSIERLMRAVLGRVNACRLGVRGCIPLGSSVSKRAQGLTIGDGFFAIGPIWLEAVTEYEGTRYRPKLEIGQHVSSSPRLHISAVDHISIGDWVLFGENVFVADHQHGATSGERQCRPDEPPALRRLDGIAPVFVGARCHIGNNVVILPGTTIGEGSIVGANSVVRGSLPPGSIAVGSPARVVKRWDAATAEWLRV